MKEKYKNIHQDLIDQCRSYDQYAQREIYKLYAKAMFNISYRITNNQNDAEDALQEAFVSAFQNIDSYKGTASFGAWLKRIVVNKSLNLLKKNRPEFVPIENADRYEDDRESEGQQIQLSVAQVKRAIQLLPEGYRVVFTLYLLEGYDHKEIAEILDITESTSKSQFNRSKKKIREILQKEVSYEGQFGTAG